MTKFADTFERVDPSAAETVVFDVSKLKCGTAAEIVRGGKVAFDGMTLSFAIPAGDVAVFELAVK